MSSSTRNALATELAPAPATVPATPAAAPPPAKPKTRLIVLGAIAAVAAVVAGGWEILHAGLESTDDAQIDAEIVSVPSRASGVVSKVLFTDNQEVKAGDVLAELDADVAKARLQQAEANVEAAVAAAEAAEADARVTEMNAHGNKSIAEASLRGASSSATASKDQIQEGEAQIASADANVRKATQDLDRAKKLFGSESIPQAQVDQAQANFDAATAMQSAATAHLSALKATTSLAFTRIAEASAKLEESSHVDLLVDQARAKARTARAQVATAEALKNIAALDVTYTRIIAPQAGVISKKNIGVGQMLGAGQPIAQLVPAQRLWVTGNFKETQVRKMQPGQAARIEIDAFPGVEIQGEVESFSAATGARFTLLPPDNASGNFTKVVQRMPVRVRLHDAPPGVVLRPGMSVDLTIDTKKAAAP